MINPIFIIEHLEPTLFPWCILEYKHISKIVGKDNVWFTNVREKDKDKLKRYGLVQNKSINQIPIKNAAVLDPESSSLLTPKLASRFNFFIFGGILGSSPRKKRTLYELTKKLNFPSFNLKRSQFSTDNAVYITKQIIKKIPISKIKFHYSPEIKINSIESTILPYHYVMINNKPLISKELIALLKKQ